MGSLVAAETLFFYHSSPPKSTLRNAVLLHLLCGARASPGLLLPGRRPPAPRGPPPRSSPSSEPQSGPGSWPPESVKQHRLGFFFYSKKVILHESILLNSLFHYLTKLSVNSTCGRYLVVKAVSDWVLRLGRNQEVCRNHAGACGDKDQLPSRTQWAGKTLQLSTYHGITIISTDPKARYVRNI